MKIKIIKNPYTAESLSIEETKKTVDFLDVDSWFESAINKLRKKYNILAEEFLSCCDEIILDKDIFSSNDLLSNECIDICSNFQLPRSWWKSILFFLKYNLFLTPEKKNIVEVVRGKDSIEDKIFKDDSFNPYYAGMYTVPVLRNSKQQFYLVVNKKTSQRKFIAQIKNIWGEIETQMNRIPKPKKHKMIRYELAKEIVRMRDIKHLSFPEISNRLREKYYQKDLKLSNLTADVRFIENLYKNWKERFSTNK